MCWDLIGMAILVPLAIGCRDAAAAPAALTPEELSQLAWAAQGITDKERGCARLGAVPVAAFDDDGLRG